jgi:structural maintenance of chromosome 2
VVVVHTYFFFLPNPLSPSFPHQELGAALKAAEDNAAKLSKELVKAKADYDEKVNAREEEEKARAQLVQNVSDTKATIAAKESSISDAAARFQASQAAMATKEEAIAAAERKVKAATMGMTEVDGEAKSFADQIREAESRASAAATLAQQAVMKKEHLQKQLAEKRPKGESLGDVGRLEVFAHGHSSSPSRSQDLPGRLPKVPEGRGQDARRAGGRGGEGELRELLARLFTSTFSTLPQSELAAMKFDPKAETAMRESRATVEKRRVELRDRVNDLSARLSSISFSYSDPVKGFDRSKVGEFGGQQCKFVTEHTLSSPS